MRHGHQAQLESEASEAHTQWPAQALCTAQSWRGPARETCTRCKSQGVMTWGSQIDECTGSGTPVTLAHKTDASLLPKRFPSAENGFSQY